MALKVVLPGEMLFMGISGYMVWERGHGIRLIDKKDLKTTNVFRPDGMIYLKWIKGLNGINVDRLAIPKMYCLKHDFTQQPPLGGIRL